MTKSEFLLELEEKIKGLPEKEIEERLAFYSEMIDDKIEDGQTEEQAVEETGSVDEITEQILKEIPLTKIVKQRIKLKKKLGTGAIVLISVGSPVWVPVLISLLAVAFSLYLCLWVVVICLYAAAFSCFGTALGTVVMAVSEITSGKPSEGIALIGAAVFLTGLGILLLVASNYAAKGVAELTKKTIIGCKKLLIKKEEAK